MSLSAFPLAQCNNGDPAAYYRPGLEEDEESPKKLLIYLKGGGVCFPNQEGFRVRISLMTFYLKVVQLSSHGQSSNLFAANKHIYNIYITSIT